MQVRNLRAPQMTPPMVLEETDTWDRQKKSIEFPENALWHFAIFDLLV